MKTLNISYLKLDLNAQIIDHNVNFAKLFQLPENKINNLSFNLVLDIKKDDVLNYIHKLPINQQQSIICFCNSKLDNGAMFILYTLITRYNDHFTVKMVNWLSWIHNIYTSMDYGYSLISKLNNNSNTIYFTKMSEAASYKALYPLLTHIPQKFSGGIYPFSMFEIMRIFTRQRKTNYYSRDYARNSYSRIRTNLKHEYNLECFEAIDLIKNDSLLRINFNGEICMPHIELLNTVLFPVNHDSFLLHLINQMQI